MGMVAIGIRIGIGLGSVETVLHITIIAICIGVGLRIGIAQWKHTITLALNFTYDINPRMVEFTHSHLHHTMFRELTFILTPQGSVSDDVQIQTYMTQSVAN